jgi:hypothetical protein
MTTNDDIAIDLASDTIRLYGIRYSLGVFRQLAFGPVGTVLCVARRDDETLTLKEVKLSGGFDADT